MGEVERGGGDHCALVVFPPLPLSRLGSALCGAGGRPVARLPAGGSPKGWVEDAVPRFGAGACRPYLFPHCSVTAILATNFQLLTDKEINTVYRPRASAVLRRVQSGLHGSRLSAVRPRSLNVQRKPPSGSTSTSFEPMRGSRLRRVHRAAATHMRWPDHCRPPARPRRRSAPLCD